MRMSYDLIAQVALLTAIACVAVGGLVKNPQLMAAGGVLGAVTLFALSFRRPDWC